MDQAGSVGGEMARVAARRGREIFIWDGRHAKPAQGASILNENPGSCLKDGDFFDKLLLCILGAVMAPLVWPDDVRKLVFRATPSL